MIGMDSAEPMLRFTRKFSSGRLEAAQGPPSLCGIYLETDDRNGMPIRIAPVRQGGRLSPAWPSPNV